MATVTEEAAEAMEMTVVEVCFTMSLTLSRRWLWRRP